ncbi:glycosyltransferase family 4 protein [Candidatus Omnitrophota bacterium]
MKILHIISSSGFYGAEQVLLNLVSLLKEDGHKPYLICLKNRTKPDPQIHVQAQKQGISSKVVNCRHKLDLGAIKEIKQFVKQENIKIIHSHGYKSDFYGLIAAKLVRIPIVATLHLWTQETARDRFYEWLDKRLIKRMNHLIPVSPLINNQLKALKIADNKVTLIPNGIDVDKFNSARVNTNLRHRFGLNDDLVIGTVGRLAQQKGQTYLIKAFKELSGTKGLKLLIVGDGYLKESLHKEVKELGIENDVVFTGAQKDIEAAYNSMNIFVLPSINEGLPLALLEAMSMGFAVIATKVGAIPYVMQDRAEGMLVSPGSIKELKEAIFTLIKDSALRKQMGEKAREKVKSAFSLETFYQKYIEVYNRLS